MNVDLEIQKRKSPRLKDYDYSRPGYYFVTICTHNKKKTMSKIVEEKYESRTELTEMGKIVDEVINNIPERFSVKIHKYVIMPNHVHLIMIIEDNELLRETKENQDKARHILDKAVGYIKMNASKKIHQIITKEKVWQRYFHDHIIKGENDYQKIWLYIHSNPSCWKKDTFYSD